MPNAIRMYRGDDKTLELTVQDATGSAVDLTGAKIWFTVKQSIGAQNNTFTKATANAQGGDDQILITDAEAGEADIYIVPSDTQGMRTKANYVADIKVQLNTGKTYKVWTGTFGVA